MNNCSMSLSRTVTFPGHLNDIVQNNPKLKNVLLQQLQKNLENLPTSETTGFDWKHINLIEPKTIKFNIYALPSNN